MIDVSMLNDNQKEAVLAEDRYLRIVAGAGSGKTRVLTMRIAHLIEDTGVPPYRILAITFTNKAANEMKERIRKMLGEEAGQPWISTIHSLCVRILREDIPAMGYPRNFTVVDAEDQKAILKEAYKKYNIEAQSYPYGLMLGYISSNKSADITPERAYAMAGDYEGERTKAEVYEFYAARLEQMYALDFDDLILWTVRMFRRFDDILFKWQRRFRYIHVDEFQDVDRVQYTLISLLTGDDNSLYVVGDPDQTIYTWRGADVNIIMNFTKDFSPCRTVILNENYRSTSNILNGANCVIRNNRNRVEKDLYTNRRSDVKITHYAGAGDTYEAAWVADQISALHRRGKEYSDIAVLYRSNYLSRPLEKEMIDRRIPYVIYGGIRFYERQEVKDAVCYLRMITSADDLAFRRVINKPRRGIGNKTVDQIAALAEAESCTMYEAVKNNTMFSGRTRTALDKFVNMVEKWRQLLAAGALEMADLAERVIDESGLRASLEEEREYERIENLKELVGDVREFAENDPESTLDEYLQQVSLYGDRSEETQTDFVRLMTVHAAKGLEFDTVFVTDLNEGIFPNERALSESSRGIEEERRLAYVAFTRAKNKLYLCEAGGFSFILQKSRVPSRFIEEIDDEYIEHTGMMADRMRGSSASSFTHFEDPGISLMDRYEKKAETAPLKTGDHVEHAKFGEGVVISTAGGIAAIAFEYPHGLKKIAAGHPSLKKKG